MKKIPLRHISRWWIVVLALAGFILLGRLVPPYEFDRFKTQGPARLLDRNGAELRVFNRGGQYLLLKDISPWMAKATVCSEDQRFYWHLGTDPLALARAAFQNLKTKRTVSGASTITMQLARIMLGPRPRRWTSKISEMLLAGYLEWRLSKRSILEMYLNLAPYGNQCQGVQSASRYYFGCPAGLLTAAQSAFLCILPRNPQVYNPNKQAQKIKTRQQKVLLTLHQSGRLSPAQYQAAISEPVILSRPQADPAAGHFCDWVQDYSRQFQGDVHTTLDLNLTRNIQKLVKAYVRKLYGQGITNAAVVVLRNDDLALLAMTGSADYEDSYLSGQVNGALALRQPGSSLKPFTYGLALERGFLTSYLLPDVGPRQAGFSGKFTPRNYDERLHGPVRMRTALGCSYNIPAVRILEELGQEQLLNKLRQAGFSSLNKSSDFYGLGLTLGNGEVTLLELTRAYAALANGGLYRSEKIFLQTAETESLRIFSPQVSYLIAHILSDRSARAPAFGECSPLDLPFACAAKTGTTKDYRDNWTAGFTSDYTVGVWVGNFDGRPMHGVSGISGAGPLFRDVMLMLHRQSRPQNFAVPGGLVGASVCPLSGDQAGENCPDGMNELFLSDARPQRKCTIHRENGEHLVYQDCYREWAGEKYQPERIQIEGTGELAVVFPSSGDVFKLDPGIKEGRQSLSLEASIPAHFSEVKWVYDGKVILPRDRPQLDLTPGRHSLYLTGRKNGRQVKSPRVEYLVLL
jgi:penicillin-binding protein 1C